MINRSYYDLRWEDNEMHLAIRNSSTKCLEVYIQESVELYHFFNENFEKLKKGTNGIWTIPTKTIETETKHKKFVLSYDSVVVGCLAMLVYVQTFLLYSQRTYP